MPHLSTELVLITIAAGILGIIAYIFLYRGFQKGNVSVVSPISASWSVITTILAVFLFQETLTPLQIVGIITVFVGIFLSSTNLVELKESIRRGKSSGVVDALISMIAWGITYTLLRPIAIAFGPIISLLFLRIAAITILFSWSKISKTKISFPTRIVFFFIGVARLARSSRVCRLQLQHNNRIFVHSWTSRCNISSCNRCACLLFYKRKNSGQPKNRDNSYFNRISPNRSNINFSIISWLTLVVASKQSQRLNCYLSNQYHVTSMAISVRLGIVSHIMRICETSKDKTRIMQQVGLNDVMAESYLTILTRQSMIIQNNGKYVITSKGQGYLSSCDRLQKIVI